MDTSRPMTAPQPTVIPADVQWRLVGSAWVRSLWYRPQAGVDQERAATTARGTVVIVPGLGLPRYTLPLAQLLASQGISTVVFDALAWRRRKRRVAPTVAALGAACAQWLESHEVITTSRAGAEAPTSGPVGAGLTRTGPVVVVGHSTGAQVGLEAVLRRQGGSDGLALVMAGPTFAPAQRTLAGLAVPALTAYRKDSPKELVVLKDLARVRTDVARLLASALRHRSEDRVGLLRVPVCLTAGEADSFAPEAWLRTLAVAAGGPARVSVLPGSHNNVFTAREEFASVVSLALESARQN